jgi:multisubunit Na+/H+ antiporter MnhC subunit
LRIAKRPQYPLSARLPSDANQQQVDRSDTPRDHQLTLSNKVKALLPLLALAISVLLYGLHFFAGGGRERLLTDSQAYLIMAQGGHQGAPYSSRVLGPFIASGIASLFGISSVIAFQILTPVALLVSLVLLRHLINQRGGPVEFQAAVLLALGCALAATFGYTPVMVDPLLLALTCLTLLALDTDHFTAAIACATLAALTKEYGLLLAFVIFFVAYRSGRRKLAFAGILVPAGLMIAASLIGSSSSGAGVENWQRFVSAMFGYHLSLFQFRGGFDYLKLQYMWSWSVLWPVLVIAAALVLSRLRGGARFSDHEVGFSLMLVALPLLLLGDWGRALLIVFPFGCAAATAHPLARNAQFAALLAIGGLSTALARPFHSESPLPSAFVVTMIVVSIASSLLIGIKILRFAPAASTAPLDSGLEIPAHEGAVR